MFSSIWQDIKKRFEYGDTVIQLILINFIAWASIILIGFLVLSPFVGFGSKGIDLLVEWLAVPSSGMTLLTRPWTIITYMFTHVGLFHIIFNMYFLYLFGTILANYLGNHRIIPVYVLGGLGGFLLYFLSANLIGGSFAAPIGHQMIGASAGVLAVVVAAAHLAPTHTLNLILIGPVQIRYIALFMILIDMLSILSADPNTGGHLAHLGGVAVGLLFIEQLKRGHDWSTGFNKYFNGLKNFFSSLNQPAQPKNQKRKGPHMAYKNEEKVGEKRKKKKREPQRNVNEQERIDSILDKIKEAGYDSLTKEEKEFLFKVSKDK